jgi:hypothetical protein
MESLSTNAMESRNNSRRRLIKKSIYAPDWHNKQIPASAKVIWAKSGFDSIFGKDGSGECCDPCLLGKELCYKLYEGIEVVGVHRGTAIESKAPNRGRSKLAALLTTNFLPPPSALEISTNSVLASSLNLFKMMLAPVECITTALLRAVPPLLQLG